MKGKNAKDLLKYMIENINDEDEVNILEELGITTTIIRGMQERKANETRTTVILIKKNGGAEDRMTNVGGIMFHKKREISFEEVS